MSEQPADELRVLCPARLSNTSSICNGGDRFRSVGLMVNPSCQRPHVFRNSASTVTGFVAAWASSRARRSVLV